MTLNAPQDTRSSHQIATKCHTKTYRKLMNASCKTCRNHYINKGFRQSGTGLQEPVP